MTMRITIEDADEFDDELALVVKHYDGPVYIDGLADISAKAAGTIAQSAGEIHLPDLETLSDAAAANLALHRAALHLDSLLEVSDVGLRALAAHPNLWIPEDISERMSALCSLSSRHVIQDDAEDGETEDEDGADEDEEDEDSNEPDPYEEDYSESVEEWEEEEYEDEDGMQGTREAEIAKETEDRPAVSRRSVSAVDTLLEPLEQLVGLDRVKQTLRSVVSLARIAQSRRREGLSVAPASYHMAFVGPPGTGKTTVARLVAAVFRNAGVLSRGHLVETDGQGLVAKYLGQTGHRVRELVERSLGGVLFIDEAYSLFPQEGNAGAYAAEAIATLVPWIARSMARPQRFPG